MEIMVFNDIYQKTSEVISINDYSQLFSDLPKSQAPLYGAFVSKDKTRRVANILYRTALTLDIDEINGDDKVARQFIERSIEYLKSNFDTFMIHETHSSSKDDRRLRIIIPIGKISKDNYEYFSKAFCQDFLTAIKFDKIITLDNKTYEPQQLMYFVPTNKYHFTYGKIADKNNIDYYIELAKQFKEQNTKPEKPTYQSRPTSGGFYDWLNAKGMTYFIDKYFADTYKFNRMLGDGQFEYKDLNSKKKAGIRITANNQVMTTWHDGDMYTNQGNGARSANIYQLLKNKGIVNEIFEEYRREVA